MSRAEPGFGARLAQARRRRGFSTGELAAECARLGSDALDAAAIAAIESGARGVTTAEVSLLALALGMAVAELVPTPLPGPRPPVRGPRPPRSGPVDFFVSYSLLDDAWATWIAHELESAGYSVMIQAWDFVPGTHFLDFIDRGIRESSAVIAVLSSNYLASQYGKLEWMAAYQAAHDRPDSNLLVPVRIQNIFPEGLLGQVTFVDMVGIEEPELARARLLDRLEHALTGRAKPGDNPRFPGKALPAVAVVEETIPTPRGEHTSESAEFPPTAKPTSNPRHELGVLHLPGPRFGRDPGSPVDRLAALDAGLARLTESGLPTPELVVISGSLTDSGSREQFDQVRSFLTGLRSLLGIDAGRLVVVPGGGDITAAACEAYFAHCRAESLNPEPPYFSKWLHYERLHRELYPGGNGPGTVFDANQPWSLIEIADLRVVVAAFNSTLPHTHLTLDEPGMLGEDQLEWFAKALSPYVDAGYLRLGVVGHTPGAAGGAGLADADALDAALGTRLNLLLSGDTSGTGKVAPQAGGIPPASAPRLLHLTRDGVETWSLVGGPRRTGGVARPWHAAARTFTPPAGPRVRQTEVRQAEEERSEHPVDQLLRRITEVLEVRHPGAAVRRLPGRPPVLRVSYPDGDLVPQFLIAAHVGEPTAQDVAALATVRRRNAEDLTSELVYLGPNPGVTLRAAATRDGIRLRSFLEFQGLLDLREYVAAQTDRLRQDRVYPPELYVPQRFREIEVAPGTVPDVREDVVGELVDLLSADEGRFVLLLGDFGRGKTFAMRTLAMRLPTELPGVSPVLIELHALDKAHSVDGLVAAHLANNGESRIDLRAFRYLLRQGRIVLLFDGFDELASRVSYDRAADHLTTLLAAAEDRAKIIVTSRTQHFQNEAQVSTALRDRLGVLTQRRILLLEDFTRTQIDDYMVNAYGTEQGVARERLEVINRVDELGGLARNPRMLSFVVGLDTDRLEAVDSAASLYEEILTAWLSYEYERANPPGAQAGLSIDEMWSAVTTLALRVWESDDVLLRLDDVAEVAQALAELVDAPMSAQQATHAVGAGSLLVRTEEGLFGFIHSSVAEFLLAKEIARHFAAGDDTPALLGRRKLSELTVEFLCDLADTRQLLLWVARPARDAVVDANALMVSKQISGPAKTDMRGAVLRGEDLSWRDLSGVDLSDADLSDTLLIGTKLSRATLRGARLRRARLDRAVLRDANLTGADLDGARLLETDLRGAGITGSSWARAALINVQADQDLWDAPALRAAAIVPGQPVLTGLRPAGVGVQFGFEDGRLPNPLSYSADGSLLAVGGGDGGVLLCDTDRGLPLRILDGHLDRVYAVDFGPPDSALVTASADGTVRFWDPATGEPTKVIADGDGHTAPIWPLRISPDGTLVAYGDSAGTVVVRTVPGGDVAHRLTGHVERVWALAFHPSAPLLATADESGAVRVWDLTTGAERHRLLSLGSAVYTLCFNADGRLLAAAGQHGYLRLWDVDTGAETHTLGGHVEHVYSVVFHPDQDVLASGDTAGQVRLWTIPPRGRATGAALQHRHATAVYHLAFSPDGRTLASGDSDGTLRVWETASGRETHEVLAHRGAVWPLAFRADSAQLATSGRDGAVRLWDPDSGRQRYELHGHGRRVLQVGFNRDGDLLAAAGNDGVVRVWDPTTGRQLKVLTGPDDQLTGAVFNPVKPVLATASNDGGVHLWHLGTWRADQELDVETEYVWASAFAPDGEVLATANDDDTVRLWWQATGREVLVLHEHRGRVRSIVFSPDGSLVATGCDDAKVRLFDRETGACLATLDGHADRVYDVRFSADGQVLASVSNDGTAVLWRVADHSRSLVVRAQRGRLWSGAFSPDGRVLAVAGDDAVVYLWDTATGAELARMAGHTRRVLSLAFSPDGRTLASGSADGTTRLWDVERQALRLTMIGLPEAWAAVTPDGRYKVDGAPGGEFWHAVGLCRFEVGELDAALREVHAVPLTEPF
ncbi:TIR domain-containing protein [Actinokineospora globicatena]|uniref:WD40 repeat n=1 Tax=Actinokineospora globicatena TaxID=103729 RepID=A0A9W6V973_9PSEU|nr:TIR domain-containing protein [Actinokineospora globicatena]GLW90678.1 hypothetical protein Aglo03_14940 [Actinokineospora globicatena]